MTSEREHEEGLSRRALFAASSAAAIGALGIHAVAGAQESPTVNFHGKHQSGITTPPQSYLAFATFDVVSTHRQELAGLLVEWGHAARRFMAGLPLQTTYDGSFPPEDSGEALGLGAANLTVTFGYGPRLFDQRFGLSKRRPSVLVDLPPFHGDDLQPEFTGGDLCIQACANDPQVAFHAVRNLAQLGSGVVSMRSLQFGSGRTSATGSGQGSTRNLLGFKDGTNNIRATDAPLLKRWVYADQNDGQPWMGGGTYLVIRRIRTNLSTWSSISLDSQERVIGRKRASGAPLTGHHEHDAPKFAKLDAHGFPVIPLDAHIRVASPHTNGGLHLLRRGYNYVEGIDQTTGNVEAGLLFICFQRNPVTQFTALQSDLARSDALSRYLTHRGSGVFACPPGLKQGESLGASLFR
ncbi:MAG: iron uptake transporter deferrochelatase/peroxidase subunit [Actinomycetes bacterium]